MSVIFIILQAFPAQQLLWMMIVVRGMEIYVVKIGFLVARILLPLNLLLDLLPNRLRNLPVDLLESLHIILVRIPPYNLPCNLDLLLLSRPVKTLLPFLLLSPLPNPPTSLLPCLLSDLHLSRQMNQHLNPLPSLL